MNGLVSSEIGSSQQLTCHRSLSRGRSRAGPSRPACPQQLRWLQQERCRQSPHGPTSPLRGPRVSCLWLPGSFSSFCPDNASFTHTEVIISSNNFASVFMSPTPSANSCNCQHGSTNTSAKDKAIISKHSSLSLHCHQPHHQNPAPLSASFSSFSN